MTAQPMTKQERVRAALAGRSLDRVPVSLWGHDFLREWSPTELAASTLEFDKPEPLIDSLPEPQQASPTATTLMAIYRYDWCGGIGAQDGAPFWTAEGMPATSDQPQGGTGPWVSYASSAHTRSASD